MAGRRLSGSSARDAAITGAFEILAFGVRFMSAKPIGQEFRLERALSLEIVRVTERAAVAAARLRGRGAEKNSDQAAVDAMRRELSGLAIDGTVVIGEGG
jgi:Bacterial fructose-1,6-bisphosphatase, glpX-encoded